MKLVVGLGNPGRRYVGTRHNVGWEVVAELARRLGKGRAKQKFHGEVVEADLEGTMALLLAPHTFMNRSGQSVVEARDFYQLQNEELLVVSDDFNLPLGKLRFRASGSAGGQKGLADVIRALGTEAVPRLRIGVGTPPEGHDPAGFVLERFAKAERPVIDQTVITAANAVVDWAREGMPYCMNRYN